MEFEKKILVIGKVKPYPDYLEYLLSLYADCDIPIWNPSSRYYT